MDVIFKTVVGSKLYGLAAEDSDTDSKGIFLHEREDIIPNENSYFGLYPMKPTNSFQGDNGKDGGEKEEWVMYSAQHFMELFVKGTPTLAEIPFVNEAAITEQHQCSIEYFEFIRENMITQHLFRGYLGFYYDQVKAFQRGKGKSREKRLRKDGNLPVGFDIPADIEKEFIEIGLSDRESITKNQKQSAIMNMREYLLSVGWYDGKSMSHAYRIGFQGVQLFTTGAIQPTMTGESLDIALRMKSFGDINNHHGRITRDEAIALVTELGVEMESSMDNSSLPECIDLDKVNDFLVEFHRKWYND